MSGRKLLFIGLNYRPEPIGIGPYTAGLAEELAARGHTVEAVVGQPYYPQWRMYDGYGGWDTREEHGVTVHRCTHYVPKKPSGGRRIAHHMSFAMSLLRPALDAARRLQPDCVVGIAPSLVSIQAAQRAAGRAGAPLWVHLQDFEVEAAFATGMLGDGGAVGGAARAYEARRFRKADLVSTISPQMVARLVEKGVPAERVVEIRNWANHAAAIAAADGARPREVWGVGRRKLVLYSGNIGAKQGLDIVIEAARLLKSRKDLVFAICGNGPNRAALEESASDLDNLVFADLADEAHVGAVLKAADIHLLPQLAGAADLVLPSKLANMLASGRPVIATAEKGTGLAQEVEGCGMVIPPEDAGLLAGAIAQLAGDDALASRLGKAAEQRAANSWSRKAVVDSFEAQLERLIGWSSQPIR